VTERAACGSAAPACPRSAPPRSRARAARRGTAGGAPSAWARWAGRTSSSGGRGGTTTTTAAPPPPPPPGAPPPPHHDDDLWVDFSLNPQLNLALRQEVLHFVTQGILQGAHRATALAASLAAGGAGGGEGGEGGGGGGGGDSVSAGGSGSGVSLSDSAGDERLDRLGALPSTASSGHGHGLFHGTGPGAGTGAGDVGSGSGSRLRSVSMGTFLDGLTGRQSGASQAEGRGRGADSVTGAYDYTFQLDNKHTFRDRYPLVFRRLRSLLDISDEWYAHQIALPAQERLAEGASGAFMFMCGAGEFMVKTISQGESGVLCGILDRYGTGHMWCPVLCCVVL
jgi:hypothetical protein